MSPQIMSNDELASFCLTENATIRDVIENLDASRIKVAFIVNSAGQILATATDGDVRRGLLKNHNLEDSALVIAHETFVSATVGDSHGDLDRLLRESGISHIPILDASGGLISLYPGAREARKTELPNAVVIMAGGLGRRLRPLTDTTPKPMLPVAGKPMVEHIIENLRLEGFSDVILSIGYLGQQIEDYFGDGTDLGVSISYVSEDQPLGTGGSLSLLRRRFAEPLVVMNGDVLMRAKIGDMVDYHNSHGAEVTVGVKVLDTQIPFGVMTLDGGQITSMEEKPTYRDYVNTGVYVIEPTVLEEIPPNQRFDMPDLISPRLGTNRALAFPLHEQWMDLGRPDDLDQAQRSLKGDNK